MNQPKFKFRDIVKDKLNGREFHVSKIELTRNGFFYAGKDQNQLTVIGCGQYEEHLELYQEPQKKKLYAYKFYMQTEDATRLDFYLNEFSPKFGRRAPEYDLDYQSQNYSTNGMPDINSRARG